MGLGFTKAEVEACIDKMWAQRSGDYEDKQAVAEELLKKLPGHPDDQQEKLPSVPETTEVEPDEREPAGQQGAGEEPEENGRGKEEEEDDDEEEEEAPVKLTMAQKLEIVSESTSCQSLSAFCVCVSVSLLFSIFYCL